MSVPSSEKSLKNVFRDVTNFIKSLDPESTGYKITVENKTIPLLGALADKAEEASSKNWFVRRTFLKHANSIKDLCVEVGHPNTSKEIPEYETIQAYFPNFENPLA